jgi:DNA mismatch repair protein MSH4
MHLHFPSLVLVPDTFLSLADASLSSGAKRPGTTSLLVQSILQEFDSVPVEPVLRKYWSDTAGKDTLWGQDYLGLTSSDSRT